ncbi:hypothetical protein EIP91_001191 [Steccherinum ochraceum]|uniref:Uncharacterized protein n=1 Tax=Steccherinum ochraceum TaxID=92696 RepID=A0A4R0RTV3_9APHY|nr:hypothetical protein EIP91_001191 [Steccherinum ochraceum]
MVKNNGDGASKMSSTPTTIMTDALGAFNKAANHAVSATPSFQPLANFIAVAEKQAATLVARAVAEADEARQERDEAVEALNAIKLERKEWQRRVDGWKTSIDKSDMTIDHQNEVIAQLREEASQWKGQLLRHEETSRREAQDWKEQYLKAEQERTRLAARVDELVAEQLSWNTHTNAHNTPYAGRTPYSELPHATSSKRASTATALPTPQRAGGSRSVPPAFDDHEEPQPRKTKAASTKPSSTRADPSQSRTAESQAGPSNPRLPKVKTNGTPVARPSTAPRASMSQTFEPVRVIRRVQAVVEVPVKEESDDEAEGLLSGDSASEYEQPQKSAGRTPSKPKAKRRSSIKSKPTVESDDDDYEPPSRTPARRKPHAEADSEDELALPLGVDDDDDSHSTRRATFSEKNTPQRPRTTAASSRSATNTKKRKLDNDATASRGTATKVAKK